MIFETFMASDISYKNKSNKLSSSNRSLLSTPSIPLLHIILKNIRYRLQIPPKILKYFLVSIFLLVLHSFFTSEYHLKGKMQLGCKLKIEVLHNHPDQMQIKPIQPNHLQLPNIRKHLPQIYQPISLLQCFHLPPNLPISFAFIIVIILLILIQVITAIDVIIAEHEISSSLLQLIRFLYVLEDVLQGGVRDAH